MMQKFHVMLNPGDKVRDRFRVERKIGGGAFGTVYLVSDDMRPLMKWALKEITEMDLPEEERRDAVHLFTREAEILRSLNHPGLPQILDFFSENDSHYLVMEYIEGKTLEEIMKDRSAAFPHLEVLPWALQICEILKYLHGIKPEPVIFRDLKPSNIMVGSDGRLRLIDFGIARYFSPRKTKDTFFLGTPGFSPPEQYGRGQSDARSDIFALGATLYYLLSRAEMEKYSIKFPPLNTVAPGIPEWLEKIVMRCLSVNPGERYQSVPTLLEDLRNRQFSVDEKEGDQAASSGQAGGLQSSQMSRIAWVAIAIVIAFVITLAFPPAGCLWVLIGAIYLFVSMKGCEKVLIIAAICMLAAILLPNFLRSPQQGRLTGCKSNLKNIGTALEMYSTDNAGQYPRKLSEITPNYLLTLPTCTQAGKVTYEYNVSKKLDYYTTWCNGYYHRECGVPNYPQYDSVNGLIEKPCQ